MRCLAGSGSVEKILPTPWHDDAAWNTARNGGDSADSEGCAAFSSGPKPAEPNSQIILGATVVPGAGALHSIVGAGTGLTSGGIAEFIGVCVAGSGTVGLSPRRVELSN